MRRATIVHAIRAIAVATALVCSFAGIVAAPGDRSTDGSWAEIAKDDVTRASLEWLPVAAEKVRAFELDRMILADRLATAPLAFTPPARTEVVEVVLPMHDGSYARFRVEESPILSGKAPALSKLRSYRLRGIDDPAITGRISQTPQGFDFTLITDEGIARIVKRGGDGPMQYLGYLESDVEGDFKCDVDSGAAGSLAPSGPGQVSGGEETAGGFVPVLPRPNVDLYDLTVVVATTGEWFNVAGSTVSQVQGRVHDIISAVSAFFESEIAIKLTLHPQTALYYSNSATDPWTNSDHPCTLQGSTDGPFNAVVSPSEYDFGHLFAYQSGGWWGCATGSGGTGVCYDNNQMNGATKFYPLSTPVIGLAHEMGHQLAADHTYSSAQCGGVGSSHAYEPGSGTTIMSYAGSCGNHNVQTYRDQYYHIHSVEEITTHVETSYNAGICGAATVTEEINTAPIVDPLCDLTIPRETAFALSGTGWDPEEDPVSFTWEQFDTNGASSPFIDDPGSDPLFRSKYPGSATRTFLDLNTPGNILPTLDDDLTMRLVARDFEGGVGYRQMSLTVEGDPFEVTGPRGITGGNSTEVTWDPGGSLDWDTPVTNVDILLSTNGGFTFPIVLAAGTPNDGSHFVTLPVACGIDTLKIRIRSADDPDCYFFDDSDQAFEYACDCSFQIQGCGGSCSRVDCFNGDTGVSSCWDGVAGIDCKESETIHLRTCDCETPIGQQHGGLVIITPGCNQQSVGFYCD